MIKDYDHKLDWYYEGNVSTKIVSHLKRNGYDIKKDNSNNVRARGADIIATKNMSKIAIEVKGYPTKYYVQGIKKGQIKKTNPKLQAKHWFSEAILSSIFNYTNPKYKDISKIALGFPKMPRYEELIEKVSKYFVDNQINIPVYLVSKEGEITITNLNKKLSK